MTKKNKLATAIVGAALTFSVCYGAHKLHAQETDPPAKMAPLDAAKLDAALAHIREIQQAAQPYQQEIAAICSQYHIDPAQLGRSVGVDFKTGEIQRAQPQAQKK